MATTDPDGLAVDDGAPALATARTSAHTPLAESAARDPIRERELQPYCVHDVEVRHVALGRITVTIEESDLRQLLADAHRGTE
jgi:IS1 family transposase